MSQDFIHLRVRSAYSLLEGAIKASDIPKLAVKNAMPAVAITDRCNLYGALEFSQYCKDNGVQPIIGCALPIRGLGALPSDKWARIPTVVVLVQNEAGYRNLMALTSTAFVDSDNMDEPHVTWDQIAAHNEGLILLSGGPDGPVDIAFRLRKSDDAKSALAAMHEVFADRF